MARQLRGSMRMRKAVGLTAIAAAVIVPVTFAASAVFGTFTVDLDRRESFADLAYRKALVRDLHGSAAPQPNALLAKPLFVASRLPFTPEPPPAVQVAAPAPVEMAAAPTYRIGGVMITPQSRKVLLRSPDIAATQWLSEGDVTAQGWTVSSIEVNKVALARGDQRVAFDLYAAH
jgi:hypothetical protein